MRMIDKDALWEIFREKQNSLTARRGGYRFLDDEDKAKYDRLETVLAYIENAPEVDAAPVVQCRKCKSHGTLKNGELFCGKIKTGIYGYYLTVKADDYCSYGERKEE